MKNFEAIGIEQIPEGKKPHEDVSRERQRESNLKRGVRRFFHAALLSVGIGGIIAGGEKAMDARISSRPKNQETEAYSVESNSFKEKNKREWNAGVSFTKEDEHGSKSFNWASTLFPIYLSFSNEHAVTNTSKAVLPYEYARQFDSAEWKNASPERKTEVQSFIMDQVNQHYAENIYGIMKGAYRADHPDTTAFSPKSITITGFASPEGRQAKGAETLEPGVIDSENITLAEKRALHGTEILEGVVDSNLLNEARAHVHRNPDGDALEENVSKILSVESQLTSQDFQDLMVAHEMVFGRKAVTETEAAFDLVVKYNEGEIKNAEAKAVLDRVFGEKRKVEFEIKGEGKEKETILVPITLLPFLSLGAFFLGKKRKEKELGGTAGEEVTPQKEGVSRNGDIEKSRLGTRNTRGMEAKNMEGVEGEPFVSPWEEKIDEVKKREWVSVWIDDLGAHFDNPETIRKGIDYRILVQEMDGLLKTGSEAQAVSTISEKIVEVWERSDALQRIEHDPDISYRSKSVEEVRGLLKYSESDSQKKFARMHSEALLTLIKEKQRGGRGGLTLDYSDVLEKIVQGYEKQLITKSK